MPIFVEHHNWKRVKGRKKWSDNTVKKFTSFASLEKYILNILEKYPQEDIKYKIYDTINGLKGNHVASITYSNSIFYVTCAHRNWIRICKENNIIKTVDKKRKTA